MEYCDIYDKDRKPLGIVKERKEPLAPGEYKLVVGVWIVSSNNEILLTKRHPNKSFAPNLWENTGGHVAAGEQIAQAAARELFEETGIRADPNDLIHIGSLTEPPFHGDNFLLRADIDLGDVILQEGETCDVKYVSYSEFWRMADAGELAPSVVTHLRKYLGQFEAALFGHEHYAEYNAQAIDKWVEGGWEWGIPVSHGEYARALTGDWSVLLTPQIPVPQEWYAPYMKNGRLDGVRLLGLASGGAQQMPLFTAAGANCTVLDYSPKQLESERMVAAREGYEIEIVKADMTKRLPFEDERFDIIFHPVSNCYVEDVYHIWNECFRVLKKGGILLAGMDNGFCFLFGDTENEPLTVAHSLPYNPMRNPALMEDSMRIDGSVQFSHTIEEQIGGQIKAGFVLTHLREDRDKEGVVARHMPQYLLTRALKP